MMLLLRRTLVHSGSNAAFTEAGIEAKGNKNNKNFISLRNFSFVR